jgi:hypothetical protein
MLDIVDFPTLQQKILSTPRKDDHRGKPRTRRPPIPSLLTNDTDICKLKTRQIVNKKSTRSSPARS